MNSMNKNQTRSSLPDLSLMNSNIFQAICEMTKIRKPQFFLRITSKNKRNIYKNIYKNSPLQFVSWSKVEVSASQF